MEVEEAGGAAAEPLRDVLRVGQRRAERNDADGALDLRRDVAHPRADHLEDRLPAEGEDHPGRAETTHRGGEGPPG